MTGLSSRRKASKIAKKAWKTRKGEDIIPLLRKVWKHVYKDYKNDLIKNEADLRCSIYFWLRRYFKGYNVQSEWGGEYIGKKKGRVSKGWVDILISKGKKRVIAMELKFKDKGIHPYSRGITNDLNKLKRLKNRWGVKFGVMAFVAKEPPYFNGTYGPCGGIYYSKKHNCFSPLIKKKPKRGIIEWKEENKIRVLTSRKKSIKERYFDATYKLCEMTEKFNKKPNLNRILSRENLYLIRWDTSKKRIKSHWQRNYYIEMQGWANSKYWKVVNF